MIAINNEYRFFFSNKSRFLNIKNLQSKNIITDDKNMVEIVNNILCKFEQLVPVVIIYISSITEFCTAYLMDSPKIKGNNIERITIEIDSAKKQQPKIFQIVLLYSLLRSGFGNLELIIYTDTQFAKIVSKNAITIIKNSVIIGVYM